MGFVSDGINITCETVVLCSTETHCTRLLGASLPNCLLIATGYLKIIRVGVFFFNSIKTKFRHYLERTVFLVEIVGRKRNLVQELEETSVCRSN